MTTPAEADANVSDVPRPPALPDRDVDRLRILVGRALRRRCPYCGASGIFTSWWSLRERCPNCNVRFEREDGYFLGAYALNLIVAEFIGLGTALLLIFRTELRDASLLWQELVAVVCAVVPPLVFFPYSRTLWMTLDLLVDRSAGTDQRHLRGDEMRRPPPR